jgi:hypothetical protein
VDRDCQLDCCRRTTAEAIPRHEGLCDPPSRQAENTIKVPNAALRFKPELSPDKLQQVYAASGIRNASHRAQQGIVWRVANEGKLVPVQIATGLTDHVNTAVTKVIAGSLNSGDVILTGTADANKTTPVQRASASPATPRISGGRMGR